MRIWPRNVKDRAQARAISNEMHAGFQALRQGCPMHLGARFATPPLTEPLQGVHRSHRRDLVGGAQSASGRPAFSLRCVLGGRCDVCAGRNAVRHLSNSRAGGDASLYGAVLAHPAFDGVAGGGPGGAVDAFRNIRPATRRSKASSDPTFHPTPKRPTMSDLTKQMPPPSVLRSQEIVSRTLSVVVDNEPGCWRGSSAFLRAAATTSTR